MYESPNDTIALAGRLLSVPLPSKPKDLANHLIELDAIKLQVAVRTADQMQILYEKRNQARLPKDSEYTDFDRKILLNANLSVVERDYDVLVKLTELIKERLDLGRQLLTFYTNNP